MIFKTYDVPVVRILNQWQVILYLSNGLKPKDVYASKNSKEEYKIVYVFDKEQSQQLFDKFRRHELDIGGSILVVDN